MASRFADLWRWQGQLSAKGYGITGVCALALKYLIDSAVARELFHRAWYPWSYLAPFGGRVPIGQSPNDAGLFAQALLLIALPFLWLGITLTVQRLRDAGQPVWLVVLFFAPVVNLLFFLLLCTLESRPQSPERQAAPWPQTRPLDAWIPRSRTGAALLSIGITAVVGFLLVLLGTVGLRTYGGGLFVALPFTLGLFSVLVYSYHEPRTFSTCLAVSLVPIGFIGAVLLVVALEGIICILMAAPIALALAALGGSLGFAIQAGYWSSKGAHAAFCVLLLFTPSFMGAEKLVNPQPGTFVVKSAVEINAPPEKVWREVIAFREIPLPKELIFRAGIAYPVRAEMIGSGPGAVRHCVFSTGAFVEPIHVWDAPRLLQFGVSENPPPMRELTPYRSIEPPHLHGYFVSHQGQFLLTALPNRRTRLEGTTWYSNAIWPESYWHWWSDYIVHRIHMRVLEHIKAKVEE